MSTSSGILGSKFAGLGEFILGAKDLGGVNSQSISDTINVSESIDVRQTIIFVSINDTAAISEIYTALREIGQSTYTSVLGSSYALLGNFVLGDKDPLISPYNRTVSDDIHVVETIVNRNPNVNIAVSDAVTVSENIVTNKSIIINVSDTVHVTTTITELNSTIYITVSDSATIAETRTSRNNTIRITVNDTAHCTDTAFGRNNIIRITVTDSIHSSDSGGGRDNITRISLTSLVHVTDTTVAFGSNNRIFVTDTVHVTEILFQINPNVNPIDHVHVSETISLTTSSIFITVHDNIHVTEILHCNLLDILVTDSIHVSTNIKFYINPLNIGITDGVSVNEKIIGHGPIVKVSVFDTVHATEVILTNRPLYLMIDTIIVTDTVVTSPHTPIKVLDTIKCHDTIIFKFSPIHMKDTVRVTETVFAYSKDRFIDVEDFVSIYDLVALSTLPVYHLNDRVNVQEQISLSNARQTVNDAVTVSDHIRYSPNSISMNDSIIVNDKAQRLAFLVQDHITVSDHLALVLNSPGLVQKVNITQTVNVNKILFRTITDNIKVTESTNLHGSIHVINIVDHLPINDGTRRSSVGGKIIIIPVITGVIVNPKLMQLTTEDTQIQLPAALLGDGREVVGEVNVVKAMEGTTRQFIQQTSRIRLTYRWRLPHIKVYELRAFIMTSLSKIVTITDWNGVMYKTQIVKNPFEFANEGVYKEQKESAEVEMIFEGIKISGD